MDIFENTMKIMSVQAIPIKFPVILVHFTQKNCYLFRDSILYRLLILDYKFRPIFSINNKFRQRANISFFCW